MMKSRSIGKSILLTFFTFGIYGIYWIVMLAKDVVSVRDKNDNGTVEIVLMLFLPFLGFYMAEKKLAEGANAQGLVKEDRSVVYLVLGLFGLWIVDLAMMQSDMNRIIDATDGVFAESVSSNQSHDEKTIHDLRQCKALFDQQLISQEEFSQKKSAILNASQVESRTIHLDDRSPKEKKVLLFSRIAGAIFLIIYVYFSLLYLFGGVRFAGDFFHNIWSIFLNPALILSIVLFVGKMGLELPIASGLTVIWNVALVLQWDRGFRGFFISACFRILPSVALTAMFVLLYIFQKKRKTSNVIAMIGFLPAILMGIYSVIRLVPFSGVYSTESLLLLFAYVFSCLMFFYSVKPEPVQPEIEAKTPAEPVQKTYDPVAAELLLQYKSLLDEGVLTSAEFESVRERLI